MIIWNSCGIDRWNLRWTIFANVRVTRWIIIGRKCNNDVVKLSAVARWKILARTLRWNNIHSAVLPRLFLEYYFKYKSISLFSVFLIMNELILTMIDHLRLMAARISHCEILYKRFVLPSISYNNELFLNKYLHVMLVK